MAQPKLKPENTAPKGEEETNSGESPLLQFPKLETDDMDMRRKEQHKEKSLRRTLALRARARSRARATLGHAKRKALRQGQVDVADLRRVLALDTLLAAEQYEEQRLLRNPAKDIADVYSACMTVLTGPVPEHLEEDDWAALVYEATPEDASADAAELVQSVAPTEGRPVTKSKALARQVRDSGASEQGGTKQEPSTSGNSTGPSQSGTRSGLAPPSTQARHGADVIAAALALFTAGHGYRRVSKELGVPKSTLQAWKARYMGPDPKPLPAF